ncbi:MAG: hypothetical protein JSU01_11685 [Bacteroidetes bacterium]|nr:hypothetical protein [Bacteroidota bacterium]
MKRIILSTLFCTLALFACAQEGKHYNSSDFFKLNTVVGEKLGNIFTRTISFKSDDFPEIVYRVGGTGIYTVTKNDPNAPEFNGVFRYDGRPESHSKVAMNNGGKTVSYDGKASTNTDGSGVLYNSLIWGNPPPKIGKGDTWETTIPQPWELGGAGTQTITVMDIDAPNHMVRLKREGGAEGFYDGDIKQLSISKDGKPLKMSMTPGATHWVGYTIFKNGLVISDELMSTRTVTLTSDSLKCTAQQREYILLNAMPVTD